MWERVTLTEGVVRFFKENGNFQTTHSINKGFQKLLNLSMPSEPFEAATKAYVDDKDASIKKEVDEVIKDVDKRPHIIAVHAHYHGRLRKGEYQFAFEGSPTDPNGSTGFLVPQTGRIKNVHVKKIRGRELYGIDNLGPVFTYITINEETTEILILRHRPRAPEAPQPFPEIVLEFDRVPTNFKPVLKGDIINIRSDRDFARTENGRHYTYLFTILLELHGL